MELEDEISVSWSPGAHVAVGSRLAPIASATLLGVLGGFALGFVVGCRRRRSGEAAPAAPMRLPSTNPDVETEL